jgi:hypothetical protein
MHIVDEPVSGGEFLPCQPLGVVERLDRVIDPWCGLFSGLLLLEPPARQDADRVDIAGGKLDKRRGTFQIVADDLDGLCAE